MMSLVDRETTVNFIQKILNLPSIKVSNYYFITDNELLIEVDNISNKSVCPHCGNISSNLHQNNWSLVRDIPMSNYQYIYQHSSNQANPYQKWIDTYVDDYFEKSVEEVIEVANVMATKVGAEELELMSQVFYRASQFEWMFWDSAYNLETWLI